MKILLIRHGMTEGNEQRRYIGTTDEPLSPKGREQLRTITPGYCPERVFVSPMKRCIETAQILFPGVEQTIVPELREMDFGIFENRAFRQDLEHDQRYLDWLATRCEAPVPEGEGKAGFTERCIRGFQNVLSDTAKETSAIALVVHGGTIMSILSRYAEDGERREYYAWNPENGHGFAGDWDGMRICSLQKI